MAGGNKLSLLEKLDDVGRLALLPARVTPAKFGAGAFAVPKSLDVDRFIMDSRPFDYLERPCTRWLGSLGSAAAASCISLQDNEILLASGFRGGCKRLFIVLLSERRNIFNLAVKPEQVAHLSCYNSSLSKEQWLMPALSTMAMGDCQAVAVGQTAHLGVILQSGALSLSQILLQHAPVPRDRCFFGLVLMTSSVERACRASFEAGELLDCKSPGVMDQVRQAYASARLPTKGSSWNPVQISGASPWTGFQASSEVL